MITVYGDVQLKEKRWRFSGEPHVLMQLKRVFGRIWEGEHGTVTIQDSDEIRKRIKWFLLEYPMKVSAGDERLLAEGAARHQATILRLDQIIDKSYVSRSYKMALPPRDYQKVAAEMVLERKGLLIADDLGVGKTVEGLAILTEKTALPAVVVTIAGTMPEQWRNQTWRFLPDLHTHVIEKKAPYALPKRNGQGPDVVISTYHKLGGWTEVLSKYAKSIIFDEVQELRRRKSEKYSAAEHIAHQMRYRCGLSATPIFNLGGEIWNIVNVLMPDALGTWEEFVREWCLGERANDNRAPAVTDPKALGSYLKSQHLMLRRTRKDVGRELPQVTKIIQNVDSDEKAFEEIENRVAALAKIILTTEKMDSFERMRAHEEFDNKLRQATGVGKAPYVADFIRMIVTANEEPVVVFAWHRAVYDILLDKLKDLKPVMFTGSETAARKQKSFDKFVNGETNVLLMSLRAGQGMDGLQKRCRTCIFAELDWTAAVMEQDIGRIDRDGQPDPVTAYFLVSESGSDPTISEALGLKTSQLIGIRDPDQGVIAALQTDKGRIKELAKRYLEKDQKHAKAGA